MDRILRPTGFVIIRDKRTVVEFVKKHLSALHWEAVATAEDEGESAKQDEDDMVFIIQKKLWLTSESFRITE